MCAPGFRLVSRFLAGAMLVLAIVTAGCAGRASDRPFAAATPPVTAAPTELACPGGLTVGTPGGLYAEPPDGYDTRDEAVEEWLEAMHQPGEPYVLSVDGTRAWVLREDGTPRMRIDLLEHDGFTAHGYEECTATGIDVTLVYPLGAENPWRPKAEVLKNIAGVGGWQTLLYRGVLVTIPDHWTRLGPGCGLDYESWVPPGQQFCATDQGINFHPAGTFQPVHGFGPRRSPAGAPTWSGWAEAGDVQVYVGDDDRAVVDQVLESVRVLPPVPGQTTTPGS